MSENEFTMIVSRLARIERRIDKLADDSVTWKTLVGIVSCATAVIVAVVTVGNAMWGG